MTERDDEAWRAIVDNYGERADLDAEGPRAGDRPEDVVDGRAGGDLVDRPAADGPGPARDEDADTADPAHGPGDDVGPQAPRPAEEEGFVPPPAPPLPYVAPPRLAAGLGVFGAPLVLLVCVVLGISVPGWLAYLLVASFVGGFAWLVANMRKRPDDPWDDGARV